jgi:hypothetical protein
MSERILFIPFNSKLLFYVYLARWLSPNWRKNGEKRLPLHQYQIKNILQVNFSFSLHFVYFNNFSEQEEENIE